MLALPIDEGSAKVRSGPPGDAKADLELPIWAGVIPFAPAVGEPLPAPDLRSGLAVPEYVSGYRRGRA